MNWTYADVENEVLRARLKAAKALLRKVDKLLTGDFPEDDGKLKEEIQVFLKS